MIKSLRAEGLTVVNFEGLKPKSIDFDCSGIGQLISFEPNSDIDNFDKFGHALHQDTGVKLSDSDY